jgi:uncharacterized protein YjbJ (UPF0337 family)
LLIQGKVFRPILPGLAANAKRPIWPKVCQPLQAGRRSGDAGENITKGGLFMNWDQIEGQWKQLRGNVKEKFGKLTDDDLNQIAGRRDQLVGKIQERYGIAKEEAQRRADEWINAQKMETQHAGHGPSTHR